MVLVREGLGRVCEFRRYEVRGFPSDGDFNPYVLLETIEDGIQVD